MSKHNFLYENRGKLTILSLIIGIIAFCVDFKFQGVFSSTIQWSIFWIIAIFIFYVQFVAGILVADDQNSDDLEYDFEEKEIPKDLFSDDTAPTVISHSEIETAVESTSETTNDQIDFRDEVKQAAADGKKVVYLVQPIIVTENELTNKLEEMKNTNDAEKLVQSGASGPVKELQQEEKGVHTYSTRLVPYRYRGMFEDIHSLAITHGPQTTDAIVKQIQAYGHPFKKIENGQKLVAFDFGFIRMPETGFFGVKLPEPKIEAEEKNDDVEPDWKARD
ncbi:MAG TPA: hypothetical protein PK289_01190 [Bacteroidia bacterium]|nr:hypothetical protein [Bacteroidia bacterium]